MVSEYESWKQVADWASALFPFPAVLSQDLQKRIADIKAKHALPADQLSAVLRFVQDDVRYMGIEMGVHSHKPHPPAQVFRQRFGDCKDKAYLFCTS
jgi:transglutaminase-like putative cysteine protease